MWQGRRGHRNKGSSHLRGIRKGIKQGKKERHGRRRTYNRQGTDFEGDIHIEEEDKDITGKIKAGSDRVVWDRVQRLRKRIGKAIETQVKQGMTR